MEVLTRAMHGAIAEDVSFRTIMAPSNSRQKKARLEIALKVYLGMNILQNCYSTKTSMDGKSSKIMKINSINVKQFKKTLKIMALPVALSCVLFGCVTPPPKNPNDLCLIFEEREDWFDAAHDAEEKWGVPIHVPMSMMYQESSFREDAQPPMEYFLGFIPLGRASTAYGYSQAKTMTWADYIRESGNSGADRDEFEDAIDFMGWFISKTHKINGVSKWDAYGQYLNYHEGWGGYKNKSYNKKKWLIGVSNKVKNRSTMYAKQLKRCREELEDNGWFFGIF
jgi:hypothetical protein